MKKKTELSKRTQEMLMNFQEACARFSQASEAPTPADQVSIEDAFRVDRLAFVGYLTDLEKRLRAANKIQRDSRTLKRKTKIARAKKRK